MEKISGEKRFLELGTKGYLMWVLRNDKNQHMRILALFAILKGISFETYKQLQFYISRNVRPAKRLEAFDLKRIKRVYEYCEHEFGKKFKVGLETIEKFILEDIDSFEDKDAILILKDGERIYDIERIAELEKEKRIKYLNNKWIEV